MARDSATKTKPDDTTDEGDKSFLQKIDALYGGRGQVSRRFRLGLLAFDLVTVAYFIVSTLLPPASWMRVIDIVIAGPLILDLVARFIIAEKRGHLLLQPSTWVDSAVIVSLLVSVLGQNLAFLRVFRALRLLRSYQMLRELRQAYPKFRQHEEMLLSALNLVVFIFLVSSVVFVLQSQSNAEIATFIDALYFTVTTLTTTGFGDITLHGDAGRLLSVLIMVVGVGLFLRLLQTIFRPTKVAYECPDCGLQRHEPDAVHCKHCGKVLHIETEGE